MAVADAALRGEYAAAVEEMAGRALDALSTSEGAVASPRSSTRAELAAARVLGADLFAPQLLHSRRLAADTGRLLREAFRVFPPDPGDALEVGWHDWAGGHLAARSGAPVTVAAPERAPTADAWQRWAAAMARLSALALPGLDSPVHQAALRDPVALARGAVRAMLRRDCRTAVRLTRWLAWLDGAGVPLPVESRPLISRIRQAGDGSARTALDLAVAQRLLAMETR
ncbi:hypothetical protein [Streptomyces sp. SID10815]|uniref:hypothetical protein n=1 Tax=Streptomyces sp. SID10815 TaxID=2706027 RepID=UPI0013C99A5F|nr:hypothetical protein [Streptomyces sp. SID10815]NEA45294.1 hypothetical protein [Streptomyces sp. SID10815]